MKHRGHYVPVAARREVLAIYRDRRTHWVPISGGPLPPLAAMQATVDYFSGWLAYAVAYRDPTGRKTVAQWADEYRAAQYYLERMYRKPRSFWYRAPQRPAVTAA